MRILGALFAATLVLILFTEIASAQSDAAVTRNAVIDTHRLASLVIYPAQLLSRAKGGRVEVHIRVDGQGHVDRTDLIEGDDGFYESIRAALGKVTAGPALLAGKPVPGYLSLTFSFRVIRKGRRNVGIITVRSRDLDNPSLRFWRKERGQVDKNSPAVTTDSTMSSPIEELPKWDPNELARKVVYPEVARRNGIQGEVVVRVLIDKEGQIRKMIVDQSVHPLLDKAALDAIQTMHFVPAKERGKPVAVWVRIPITFQLK